MAAPRRTLAARRWLILGLIIGAGVLNYVDRQIIAVLKPVIETDLHWSDVDYGRLASLFQLAAAAGYLVTGRIVDRLGVKWANPLGVAAWSLAALAHGWARSFLQFALARMALGATESMGTPSSIKTIASLFSPAQRGTAIGISNGATNVGAILTPLFLPAVAIAWGWRGAFVGVGLVGLIWTLAWIAATTGLANDAAPATISAVPDEAGGSILRDKRTWAIAGAKALSDQVWWLLLFWTPDFLHREFGLGLKNLGAPLATIYSCAAAGSILAGVISTRLIKLGYSIGRVRKGALLLCALLATAAPLALTAHREWMAVGVIGLVLAAHQGFSVNLFALVADIVPRPAVGRVTSLGSLCGNLAGMGIVYTAGVILSAGAGYGPILAVVSVSYLLAVGWIQLLLPKLSVVAPGSLDLARG
jgi:ACS family hexuronate transporter-like MFS transporter